MLVFVKTPDEGVYLTSKTRIKSDNKKYHAVIFSISTKDKKIADDTLKQINAILTKANVGVDDGVIKQ